MTASNRDAAIRVTLGYEGGYTNDPQDPGGPTNWGITIVDARKYWKADATAADVRGMSSGVAVDIYRQRYWAPMHNDDDPDGVDLVTFDYGVNSGIGRAVPVRARTKTADAIAWVQAICAERLSFLHRLRTWPHFGGGWGRRVADVEARGVKMALQAQGHAPEAVNKKLDEHSADASKQAKKDIGKAGGAVVVPGSTQIPDAPHHVDLSALPHWLFVVVGLAVAGAVVVFVYRYWVNKKRAAAYATVAKP